MAKQPDDVLRDVQLIRDKARQNAKRVEDEAAVTDAAALQFLSTESDTGLTLARIALDSDNAAKKSRNRENARRAFDTVRDHLQSVSHLGEQLEPIQEKMKKLAHMLVCLGEKL